MSIGAFLLSCRFTFQVVRSVQHDEHRHDVDEVREETTEE